MAKKYIKIPEDIVDKILLTAKLTEDLTGKPVVRDTIMQLIEDEKIELTENEQAKVDKAFPK